MIYSCLDFYKRECGAYQNVFVHMKKTYKFTVLSPFIFILLSTFISLLLKISLFSILSIFLNLCIFVIFLSISFYIFNRKAKMIVKKKFDIDIGKGVWKNNEVVDTLSDIDKHKMIRFLRKKSVNSIEQYTLLRDKMEDELKVLKPKFPVVPSIFGALIISLYNNLISWLFDRGSSYQIGMVAFGYGILIIFVLASIYWFMKVTIDMMNEMFYSKDYDSMKKCHNLIERIIIEN